MASGRIVSSQEGRSAATQMKQTINGGVQDEVNRLIGQGNVLADPNNFDGPSADQYRQVWQQAQGSMKKMVADLNQLQMAVEGINRDIALAGGGQ